MMGEDLSFQFLCEFPDTSSSPLVSAASSISRSLRGSKKFLVGVGVASLVVQLLALFLVGHLHPVSWLNPACPSLWSFSAFFFAA